MNIQHPELIRQTQKFMKKHGIKLSFEQAYQQLVKNNFIDKDGNPTKWAIDNGLVGEAYNYNYPNGIAASTDSDDSDPTSDADLNAVFSKMPPDAFHYMSNGDCYAIECEPLAKAIHEAINNHELTPKGIRRWREVLAEAESRNQWKE